MGRHVVICATNPDLSEMRDLVSSLGHVVIEEVVQQRRRPDPKTFLGSGKIEALGEELATDGEEGIDADLVVVAGDLEPAQALRLEGMLGVEVYDRARLVLEIFRDRADSEEAKLQVELAELTYELPLLREAIHQAKTGERPGFLAGGATAYENQIQHVRRRMNKIRDELEQVKDQRAVRRKHRRRGGLWQVSLAGYTNAGKSTLLNQLTSERMVAENRLFSTLETRTRRIDMGSTSQSRVLVTDTVGFIDDLPPWLIEAFHATLEEIAFADLVLLIVDASEPLDEVEDKVETSLEILRGFLADRERTELANNLFLVFNKVDQVPDDRELAELAEDWGFSDRWSAISAETGQGVDKLVARMRRAIPDRTVITVELPYSGESYALIDHLDAIGELELVQEQQQVSARAAVPQNEVDKVRADVEGLGGRMVVV